MKDLVDSRTEADRLYLELGLEGGSENWLFHLKPQAISLSIDTSTVFTFDREGRPYSAFAKDRNYRRGLDGRILEKYSKVEDGQKLRQFLNAPERSSLLAQIHMRLQQLAQARAQGRLILHRERPAGALSRLQGWLDRLLRWDGEALEADSRRFHQIYYPVNMLPPDQYMALVVQVTQGCLWNRCSFCGLYRDREFHIRSPQELRVHLEAIRNFLGEGMRLRRSIFLGDASILTLSQQDLLETFAQVRDVFAGGAAGPQQAESFYGFTDIFGVKRHSSAELQQLRQAGLQRLYVGLESGNESLRHLLYKPGTASQAIEVVREIRRAGIGVGVIVMLGLGGSGHAGAHEQDTIRALNAMELGKQDMIYFSPLVEFPDRYYAQQVEEHGFMRMGHAAMCAQQQRIEAGLRFADEKPHTAFYDIRDYIY